MIARLGEWWRFTRGILLIVAVGVGIPLLLLSQMPLLAVSQSAGLPA